MYRGHLNDLCCSHLLYLEGLKVCDEHATIAQKLFSAGQFTFSCARSKITMQDCSSRVELAFSVADAGQFVRFTICRARSGLITPCERMTMHPGILRERSFRVRNNQRRANFRPAAYAGRLNAEPRTESRAKRDSRIPRELTEFSSRGLSLFLSLSVRSHKQYANMKVKIVRSEIIT